MRARVPLGPTEESTAVARACVKRCEHLGGSDSDVALCVGDCPGAVQERGACAGNDDERRRRTICKEYKVARADARSDDSDLVFFALMRVAFIALRQ
jgi:hypothetical protein